MFMKIDKGRNLLKLCLIGLFAFFNFISTAELDYRHDAKKSEDDGNLENYQEYCGKFGGIWSYEPVPSAEVLRQIKKYQLQVLKILGKVRDKNKIMKTSPSDYKQVLTYMIGRASTRNSFEPVMIGGLPWSVHYEWDQEILQVGINSDSESKGIFKYEFCVLNQLNSTRFYGEQKAKTIESSLFMHEVEIEFLEDFEKGFIRNDEVSIEIEVEVLEPIFESARSHLATGTISRTFSSISKLPLLDYKGSDQINIAGVQCRHSGNLDEVDFWCWSRDVSTVAKIDFQVLNESHAVFSHTFAHYFSNRNDVWSPSLDKNFKEIFRNDYTMNDAVTIQVVITLFGEK